MMPPPHTLATHLLEACLHDQPPPEDELQALLSQALSPDEPTARAATSALLGILAEGLADRFDPHLAHAYASLFSRVFAAADPSLDARALYARYLAIRQNWPLTLSSSISQVYVLSRVTLGADVCITSAFLDAARRRFPSAQIFFAGPEKNYQLFAAAPWLRHFPLPYCRATLRDALEPWRRLLQALPPTGALVLDPDSRLLQLGLLPLPSSVDYGFFESRSYGNHSDDSLYTLAPRWIAANLSLSGAAPFLAPAIPRPLPLTPRTATVSFGVGGNPNKRLKPDCEAALLAWLAARGFSILLDEGGSPEEAASARAALAAAALSPTQAQTFSGPFALFADAISRSSLYLGYDSAGQHVAAVAATPALTLFAGYPNERFLHRWSPVSPRSSVIPLADSNIAPPELLPLVEAAFASLAPQLR